MKVDRGTCPAYQHQVRMLPLVPPPLLIIGSISSYPSIRLRFPPRLVSSLCRQPEISEFVWNSLPVLLGGNRGRPTEYDDGRRQRSGDGVSGRAECEWIMPRRYSTPGPRRSAVGVAVPLRCSAAPLRRSSPRSRFSHTPASMQTLLSARRRFATRPLTLRVNHPHVPFSVRNFLY